jgi:hypothetical protein
MKCVEKSNPKASIPNTNGVKKPQTGHKLLVKVYMQMIPFIVINGMTLGQYADHASESFKPLIFGKYTPR